MPSGDDCPAAADAGLQLKIYRAHPVEMKGEPGQILSDGRTYFAIATADGALALDELQLEGKRRMDVKAFLAGFRDPETYCCI